MVKLGLLALNAPKAGSAYMSVNLQNLPLGQGMQSLRELAPMLEVHWPLGQALASAEPSSQYAVWGHSPAPLGVSQPVWSFP